MPGRGAPARRSPAVSTNRQVSPSSSTSESTGSMVVPASWSTTDRDSPVSLFSSDDLPTLGLPSSATRRGPLAAPKVSRGASGRARQDRVEQIAGSTPVQGGDRERLPQSERPQRRGVGLAAFVVDLVGHQDHRHRGSAEHPGHRLVGDGRADRRVDHDHHHVGGSHGPIRLRRNGCLKSFGVGLPAAGVHDGEPLAVPQRRRRRPGRG